MKNRLKIILIALIAGTIINTLSYGVSTSMSVEGGSPEWETYSVECMDSAKQDIRIDNSINSGVSFYSYSCDLRGWPFSYVIIENTGTYYGEDVSPKRYVSYVNLAINEVFWVMSVAAVTIIVGRHRSNKKLKSAPKSPKT